MNDPSAAESPYGGAPVPPAPASPGTGVIGRAWLLAGGLGCGCVGVLSLCAVIALFTVVIGPAVRERTAEPAATAPPVAAAPQPTATPEPTRPPPTPTAAAVPTPPPPPTAGSTVAPPTPPPPPPPPPTPTAAQVARPAPAPPPRGGPVLLPEPFETIEVGTARLGVIGLSTLDAEGRVVIDSLGSTSFSPEQSGLAAVFTYERARTDGTLSLAGIWVASQGERVTPLADPVNLEVNAFDEGQPLVFHITFRSGAMPQGAYAFGLFTLENGQVDRLVKRLDFIVE